MKRFSSARDTIPTCRAVFEITEPSGSCRLPYIEVNRGFLSTIAVNKKRKKVVLIIN
jgi:hypothetical protein